MDEILSQLTASLGSHPGQTEVGAGALLNLIREHASQGDFDQLLKAVPEAAQWMGKAANVAAAPQSTPEPGEPGAGLFGEIAGVIGSLTGGSTTGVGGLLSVLTHSGLSLETLTALVPQLLGLLEQRGGSDLLQRIAAAVPMLRDFLGNQAGGQLAEQAPGQVPQGGDAGGILGEIGELGKMFGS
jgi:hypothetical protein